MQVNISLSTFFENSNKTFASLINNRRIHKGNNIIDFPSNFCIVDLETTGFSPDFDKIIEIGALKYSNDVVIDTFQSLVHNEDTFLTQDIITLTGITEEMLKFAPSVKDVLPLFDNFLGDSIIVGYNTTFDVNFLYDNYLHYLNKPLTNYFIDCFRIAKKLYPEMQHHRLKDMIKVLRFDKGKLHRALNDCEATAFCFYKFKEKILSKYKLIEDFRFNFRKSWKAADIKGDVSKNNPDNPLYNKYCVFTGKLEKFIRKDAMKIVADLGGINQDNVNKDTNFLILGNNDYCTSIKGGKSTKHKKAEKYKQEGQDIEIISETVFYDMIADNFNV